jgi:hypothetical protein
MAEELKEIEILNDINKTISKFTECMAREDESIYEAMPLNLGDMMTKKGDLLEGEQSAGSERQMYFDFDIFDRFDKKGTDKFDAEKVKKIKEFQKIKYCSRMSGLDRI